MASNKLTHCGKMAIQTKGNLTNPCNIRSNMGHWGFTGILCLAIKVE